jgi:hypothetical protein
MANRERARLLLETIQAHRDSFHMALFLDVNGDVPEDGFRLKLENIDEGRQQCGTTLCAAGFAQLLAGVEVELMDYRKYKDGNRLTYAGVDQQHTQDIAEEWLDITSGLGEELFFTDTQTRLTALEMLANGISERAVIDFIEENGGSLWN